MTIPEFIKLFDKKAIEEAKVSFTINTDLKRGGKWVYWCEKGTTAEKFIKNIEENSCINDIELDGFQDVQIVPQDKDSVRVVITFD